MNRYVSFARFRLNARHFPLPPHISQGTMPAPEHSRQPSSTEGVAASAEEEDETPSSAEAGSAVLVVAAAAANAPVKTMS